MYTSINVYEIKVVWCKITYHHLIDQFHMVGTQIETYMLGYSALL